MNKTIILIVIIIFVILGVVVYTFKDKILGTEKMTLLNEPTYSQNFTNSIHHIIEKIKPIIKKYNNVDPKDMIEFEKSIKTKANTFYNKNISDEKKINEDIVTEINNWIDDGLTIVIKDNPLSVDMLKEFDEVIQNLPGYLEYRDIRYTVPIIGLKEDGTFGPKEIDRNRPINPDLPISHNFVTSHPGKVRIKPGRLTIGNNLTEEVNKDHNGLMKNKYNKLTRGINSTNLTSGIKRKGYSTFTKGKQTGDIRGRPKALIRRLASLNSSSDPNSLTRFADGGVNELLMTSKGLSNELMWNDAVDDKLTRDNNGEYRQFKNIRDRMVDRGQSYEGRLNNTTMNNMIADIKSGYSRTERNV